MKKLLLILLVTLCGEISAQAADIPKSGAPSSAVVYIISPADGEVVPQKFIVKFGLRGMGVAPAGTHKPNTGHHHLLVDMGLPEMNKPMGSGVKHVGGGQTETPTPNPKPNTSWF